MDVTNIPNAPHWLNNSVVIVKEDYTAGDMSWVMNSLARVDITNQELIIKAGHQSILTIKRMVQPGSVVSVKRSGDRVKTVHLPDEAEDLLDRDMKYIIAEIDNLQEPPMTEEEKKDSSMTANAHSQANLTRVK